MKCIICYNNANFYNKYPKLNIYQCPNCKHLFWHNNNEDFTPKNIYDINYFTGKEYSNYEKDKLIIEKNFKRKINLIKKYISSGNLLEIGSAYGFFLNLIKNQFNIMGFEICKDAANYAKYNFDINLISKEFNTYNFNKSFDLICMWDVIEHLINPDIIIKKISQVIKPGGYLFLSTGDISRIVPSLRKEKWRLIHPPSHIHYFSKKTLELILKNHGFSIISIEYPGIWRSFHQLLSSMFNIKSVYKYIPGKFYINFFDIMEVVAKKNEE